MSTADALAWWLFLALHDGQVQTSTVVVAATLFLLPAGIAGLLLTHCGAWLQDGSRRCRRVRRGLLWRCEAHRGAWVVSYDVAGVLALVVALVGLAAFLRHVG